MASGLEIFPGNLQKILDLNGMSGQLLAAKVGVTGGNVSHWLKGRSIPSKAKITQLEEALGCSIWILFHPEGPSLLKKLQQNQTPSARELMKMQSKERERILTLASEQVLDDYLHDNPLTDFEAFDPDVGY